MRLQLRTTKTTKLYAPDLCKYAHAFTLVELLVVIAVMVLLMSIMIPVLAGVRTRAKVLAVNMELEQIALALECYFHNNSKFPPTREDCHSGSLKDHLYQLPDELVRGGYLPASAPHTAMASVIEDRFNRGHTYKYRSLGECIRDRNRIDPWIRARLWVPKGFPEYSSLEESSGRWYDSPQDCPVQWTLFSLGPWFDERQLEQKARNRYPVPKQLWYDSNKRRGLIVRIRMKDGQQIGTFNPDL